MIRKKTLRLLLCDYQRTACYYTIYRTFKRLSSDDFTTIPRLSAWRSYDYFRSCYDYSSRNAATISDLYWLSGESPKRDAAASRQWFRPLPGLPSALVPLPINARKQTAGDPARRAMTADSVPYLQLPGADPAQDASRMH